MMTSQGSDMAGIPAATRAEAAAWIARLHGPQRSESLEAGFRDWLRADPQNAASFEAMTELWDAVAGSKPGRIPRANSWSNKRSTHKALPYAMVASLVLVVAIGTFVMLWVFREPVYTTSVGQQKVLPLKDGSRVTLNSNTELSVHFDAGTRLLRLQRGEAFFEVARDASRPFRVIAGDREVTALGTSFIVRHEVDSTAVTLVEGKVAVTPLVSSMKGLTGSQSGQVVLRPGERFAISAAKTELLDRPAPEAIGAWRHGEIVMDHTPMGEAAADLNRYNEIPIVIDEARIAALRISGSYRTGDARGFAHAVANMYGLQIEERNGELHINSTSP